MFVRQEEVQNYSYNNWKFVLRAYHFTADPHHRNRTWATAGLNVFVMASMLKKKISIIKNASGTL